MALCRNDWSSQKELLPAAAQEARGKKQEARGKKQGAPRRAQKEELGGRGLVDRGGAVPGGRGRRKGLVQGSRDKAQASVAQDRDSCLDRHSAPPPPPRRPRARSTCTDVHAFIIQIQPAASARLNRIGLDS